MVEIYVVFALTVANSTETKVVSRQYLAEKDDVDGAGEPDEAVGDLAIARDYTSAVAAAAEAELAAAEEAAAAEEDASSEGSGFGSDAIADLQPGDVAVTAATADQAAMLEDGGAAQWGMPTGAA